GFLCREIGLERAAFEAIEVISILDLCAFLEQPFLEKRGDACDDVDPTDRLDSSEKLAAFGNRSFGRFNDTHRRRAASRRLRSGRGDCCDREGACGQQADRYVRKVHLSALTTKRMLPRSARTDHGHLSSDV